MRVYRDEKETLKARLVELEQQHRRVAADADAIGAQLETTRKNQACIADLKRQGLFLLLVPFILLAAFGAQRIRHASGEAAHTKHRIALLHARLSAADNELKGKQAFARRQVDRYASPVSSTPKLDALYQALRPLDANDEDDARLIVSAIACSKGQHGLASSTSQHLDDAHRSKLEALCQPFGGPIGNDD